MTQTTKLVRRAAVTAAALGLTFAGGAAPTAAAPAHDKKVVDCVDYTGKLPRAPKGSIPRDDEGVGEEVGQTVGEEVGELADGRTIRFFSWATPGDET